MRSSTPPDDDRSLEHVRNLVRSEYAERVTRGHSDARALQHVAIDLGLSLEDCARAVERTDLLDVIGDGWVVGHPSTTGPITEGKGPC